MKKLDHLSERRRRRIWPLDEPAVIQAQARLVACCNAGLIEPATAKVIWRAFVRALLKVKRTSMKRTATILALALALALPAAAQTITVGPGGGTGTGGAYSSVNQAVSNVPAGSLIVVNVLWGDSSSTLPGTLSSVTDGGDTFTCGVEHKDATNHFAAEGCYVLSATGGASVTFTATFSAVVTGPEIVVATATLSSGTWAFDAENGAAAETSTAVNTGSVTTKGTTEFMVFSAKLSDAAATASSPQISGATPTEFSWSPYNTYDHGYYRTTGASGAGTLTYSASTNWAAELQAFKPSGGGTTCVPTLALLGVGGACG